MGAAPWPRLATALFLLMHLSSVSSKALDEAAAAEDLKCPSSALHSGAHCVCPPSAPFCVGPRCLRGKTRNKVSVEGFRIECGDCACIADTNAKFRGVRAPNDNTPVSPGASTSINVSPDSAKASAPAPKPADREDATPGERVLIMTVATHREPFIDLVEKSVAALNKTLLVAGAGDFFQGYGWKLQQVTKTLEKHKDDYDIVIFTDSFDSYIFSDLQEILRKFRQFKHPMVVSVTGAGEVNCWPNPHLASQLPFEEGGRYRYPNSGGYIAEIPYLLHLYKDVIAITHKSKCVDDQGELIKPCILHANGWDKGPLLRLLMETGRLPEDEYAALVAQKKTLDKAKTLQDREEKINKRCGWHNPNPSLFPERNLIRDYSLGMQQRALQTRLVANGIHWHTIEQQIYEIQEYRAHCPLQTQLSKEEMVQGSCDNFKVYTYPSTPEQQEAYAGIHQAVRNIMLNSPYATPDPSEACVIVPDIDVTCWCESCLYGAYGTNLQHMHPVSAALQRNLSMLPLWKEHSAKHLIFEFSDAPCLPWNAGDAIIAKVGLSEFHYRSGKDVSMPLFGMVDFLPAQRRISATERRFLLTFRGTRSARSDAMRNQLHRIHNGDDIVLLVACRFFGEAAFADGKGYDANCSQQEVEFEKYTYTELSLGAKFSLIVEGFGYHSFRLTEVLAAGSIPVIVVDHYVLPYESLLDWENFSIRIPEHRFLELPDILRAIPEEKMLLMQKRAIFIYENFFRTLGYQLHTALEEIRMNMMTHDRAREERAKLLENGFAYSLPESMQSTPPRVLTESKWCNTPVHRRKKVRDGAVMRRL